MIDIALSQHELQQIYQSTETDELVDRVRHKTLTPPAHQLVLHAHRRRMTGSPGQRLADGAVPIGA